MIYRKAIRKKDFDYSAEAFYFITICTHFKEHTLAKICNDKSELTSLGAIVQACWENIPVHFPSVKPDAFVTMPNHVHGILELTQSGKVLLSSIIQNFKSVSTRRINNVRRTPKQPVWQQNYYERIVRTERELNLTRLYVILNPLLWAQGLDLAEANLTEKEISDLLEEFRKRS